MTRNGKSLVSLILLCAFVLGASSVFAQDSKFHWGLSERLRNTYMNNLFDYNDDNDDKSDFMRIRTSVWADYKINDMFYVYGKLTNENRPYFVDYKGRDDEDWNLHEIFVDNLYLKFNCAKFPVTATIGRQNMIFGEGFIILEGGPWDGSRAIYHDAVRVTAKKGKNTTIDLFAIANSDRDSLGVVASFVEEDGNGDKPRQLLNATDEKAFGIYVTNKAVKGHQVEGYFISKTEDYSDELLVNTLGGRLSRPMKNKLAYATEWAYQMGSQGDNSISAFGGYAHASYLATPKYNTILKAGINYMSGDDPSTGDIEGWNPIFSRWPKWSELYIYTQAVEMGHVAYWTNTMSPYLQANMTFCKYASLSATYYHMRALQEGRFTEEGLVKGNELQFLLKLKLTPQLTGHFLYNTFTPGDYFPDTMQDTGKFVRVELFYNFKK